MATSQQGVPNRGETRARGQDTGAWAATPRAPERDDLTGRDDRTERLDPPPRTAKERPARRQTAERPKRTIVQRHATIRKVDPWSVLKLSLIFYLCVLLVVMLGLAVFWAAVNDLGVIETVLGFLRELQVEVTVDGGSIGRAVFLLGVLNVVLWSGINVFLAFLYNLVADLVGGLRVTLGEED